MITEPTEHEEKLLLLYLRGYRLQSLAKLHGDGKTTFFELFGGVVPWWQKERRQKLAQLTREFAEIKAAIKELEGLTP